ncbi:MAG: 1-acyl-sn-glycerol-3-phosphate acyltransferase [Planctomycetes bacterium]|nr:1-acyl-sn-glycerol-3-phosphate acyltransferase [Planctomycetota bacterium]
MRSPGPSAPAPRGIRGYRAGLVRRALRRVVRFTAGWASTLWRTALWAAGLPFQRTPERQAAWRVRCFQGWARALCRIGAIELEVVGPAPRGPCVLVTNHVGYADILALAAVLEAPAFVSMHEIRGLPLVGFMAHRMGTIFVDRRKKRAIPDVNAAIERALDAGRIVVLFAEGANSDGSLVRPFRPSMLEPAARIGAACAWGALRYDVLPGDPPPSQAVCWHEQPIWVHAPRFLALERIRARIEFGDGRVVARERKQLAAQLHARVTALFRPME